MYYDHGTSEHREMQGHQDLKASLDPMDKRDPLHRVSLANQANRAPRDRWDQPVLWEHQDLRVSPVSVEHLDQRDQQEHLAMLYVGTLAHTCIPSEETYQNLYLIAMFSFYFPIQFSSPHISISTFHPSSQHLYISPPLIFTLSPPPHPHPHIPITPPLISTSSSHLHISIFTPPPSIFTGRTFWCCVVHSHVYLILLQGSKGARGPPGQTGPVGAPVSVPPNPTV